PSAELSLLSGVRVRGDPATGPATLRAAAARWLLDVHVRLGGPHAPRLAVLHVDRDSHVALADRQLRLVLERRVRRRPVGQIEVGLIEADLARVALVVDRPDVDDGRRAPALVRRYEGQ